MSLKPLRTLFPHDGQPTLSPGLLALVTVLQFAEGLSSLTVTDILWHNRHHDLGDHQS